MRTTIDLPDALFRQVKARAALDGMKLKELIRIYVESGLRQVGAPPARPTRERSELPVARVATGRPIPLLSSADLESLLEEEEAANARGG